MTSLRRSAFPRLVLPWLCAGGGWLWLPAAEIPGARENPDVTPRGAPRPLAPGAVTGDWATFLGPTHNLVSPET